MVSQFPERRCRGVVRSAQVLNLESREDATEDVARPVDMEFRGDDDKPLGLQSLYDRQSEQSIFDGVAAKSKIGKRGIGNAQREQE